MQSNQPQDLLSLDNESNYSNRDVLLIKCKAAIEELHKELKCNQDVKEELASEVIRLQERNNLLNNEIKRQQKEIEIKEDELKQVSSRNHQLEQYKTKYQECMLAKDQQEQVNKKSQSELEHVRANLERKEKLENDWEQTIRTIQDRINVLEKEKEGLRSENIQLEGEVEKERKENDNYKIEINEVIEQYNQLVKQFETVQETHEQEIKQVQEKQMKEIEQSHKQVNSTTEKQSLQFQQLQYEYNEKLIKIQQGMEIEIKEHIKEKEQLQKTLNGIINENQENASQMNRSFIEKQQIAQSNYLKEMAKLQLIIDDQQKLIDQFEMIMDKEKGQFVETIENLNRQNNLQKSQINDIVNKNHNLTLRLQDAQEQGNQISQDFLREQQIARHFEKEIQNLQYAIESKDRIIDDKSKELHQSKIEQNKTLQQIKILMKDLEEITTEAYSKEQQYKQIKYENELLKQNRGELIKILQQYVSTFVLYYMVGNPYKI